MTVRWKPLLILSGLFLVVAVVGVIAMAYTLVPRGSADILPLARAERAAKRFEKAEVHYKRALQTDEKNAAIHEEFASMYAEWGAQAPADKTEKLRFDQLSELVKAAKFDKKLKGPRRLLLADAMRYELTTDVAHWSKEVLVLEPENADAHYELADLALEERAPNVPEIKRHLAAVVARSKDVAPVRLAWLQAHLADSANDVPGREQVMTATRALALPADAGPVDRMAMVRLRALDVQTTTDPALLPARVETLQAETRGVLATPPLAPARTVRLSLLLERIQKTLTQRTINADPKIKAAVTAVVDAIDGDVETLFKKALDPAGNPEFSLYLTYADHLRYREKRAQCLDMVARALKTPMAARPNNNDLVMGLHSVAIEAALTAANDPNRFEKAAGHIKELLGSSSPRYQGLGHLFQGAIDLELSGVAGAAQNEAIGAPKSPTRPKLRVSALNHLKIAANQLPDIAEAQARYGVALVLAQEQNLGRQYLQNALKMGNLAAQYQVWSAWSMVQAGYPEEAEPIVNQMLAQIARGEQPRDLEGTLHLLNAEIHQARRTPADLKAAIDEYVKSVAAGQEPTPAVQLRLAQIDVQLHETDRALKRLEKLRTLNQGGPAVEHLAVLTLQQQGKKDEARKTLDAARKQFPDNEELVGLDAAFLAKNNQAKDADRVLAEFLAHDPDNLGITLLRAQILSEVLKDEAGARKLLVGIADRGVNSAPLVQLALLDLKKHDYDAVAKTIAVIRSRWKEAATGDLLEAQLALDQGNVSAAIESFDVALKKDPNNKLVQFWKAQLDSRVGATTEASQALEEIVKDHPTKEMETGQTLMTAAESALANLALQTGDFDTAISRFEELRRNSENGTLNRADRWQLAQAYAEKGQWPTAKKEVATLLNDPKAPVSDDERVRGANFYRLHKDDEAASAQLDYVLKLNPNHPGAVVTRAYMYTTIQKAPEAAAIIRTAIAATPKAEKAPAVFYLMLAAVENRVPPEATAADRALAALTTGIDVQPESIELVRAKYQVLNTAKGAKDALAFIEEKAKNGTDDRFRRMLAEIYRERNDYAAAERVVRGLLKDAPKDATLLANLIQVLAYQAVAAAEHNDRALEKSFNEKCASLVRDCRTQFPSELMFVQADCDLAARRGDLARAAAITQEMDKIAKNSPSGPLNRARLYNVQGRTREAAEAFDEALERNPRQPNVRLLLGQARLKLGATDEAVRQAKLVLETNKGNPEALLLEARALASAGGSPSQQDAQCAQAVALLTKAITDRPKFVGAYHEIAEIELKGGRRAEAVASLKKGLAAVPDDATGVARLVEILVGPNAKGEAPAPAAIADAKAVAAAAGERDTQGNVALALAVGFHKAGQLELALPWAEKAAARLDTPMVHLTYGDLLLSIAEAAKDPVQAKADFERAVAQYDLVLKTRANSVEAINNKAWILHSHLGDTGRALELASGLLGRVDPSTLPAEFFDTLGVIQESKGKARDAEDSYSKGLRKVPEHAVLNYHMGKLIAADRNRARKAVPYLEKALAAKDHLSPAMAADSATLIAKVRSVRGN